MVKVLITFEIGKQLILLPSKLFTVLPVAITSNDRVPSSCTFLDSPHLRTHGPGKTSQDTEHVVTNITFQHPYSDVSAQYLRLCPTPFPSHCGLCAVVHVTSPRVVDFVR
ncbi:hypothetical protein R5R35_014257 [Gryllus longicercus]|uniref:Uncharacterized protein n=1 Tax=Gryllus longicercus TaxID=2509291 RepID=A0AAN9WME0_9ORTH